MRAEDVKEWMLVLYSGMVCRVLSKGEDVCYLVTHNDTGSSAKHFPANCSDFEPYEEPKDDKTIKVIAEESGKMGDLISNWDSLHYKTPEQMDKTLNQPREELRKLYEESAPITQEFIESFWFVKGKNHGDVVEFNKIVLDVKEKEEVKAELFYSEEVGYSLWIQTMTRDRLPVFVAYPCTTQSELRFLLTKGRIDCSI